MNPLQFINNIALRKGSKTYLEIGCCFDATFKRVSIPIKIGVDPVQGGTHRMTSDDFFNEYTGPPFDVIFVDGLHEREQVKRDIVNGLDHLSEDGIVIIDDCLPVTIDNQFSIEEFEEEFGAEPPAGRSWNGDVWKGVVDLRSQNFPDICVLNESWGIGIALARQNSEKLDEVPLELDWQSYCHHKNRLLRVVNRKQAFSFLGL